MQTFLQRDVRALTQVNDELQFYRFLCAAASYTGSMINYAALAKEAEITVPTAKQWLKVLAAAGLVYLLEPFMHPNLKYGAARRYILLIPAWLLICCAGVMPRSWKQGQCRRAF
ncbi:MAG: DUF4143 domain-containing protein [Phascolarctobacterium faecium]